MNKYKRLTHRNGNNIEEYCKVGHCHYADECTCKYKEGDTIYNVEEDCKNAMIDRLAELEDKIENRTLIEFPCNIGTEVYVKKHWYGMDVLRKSPKYMVHKTIVIEGQEFYHGEVVQFIITKKQVLMKIKFEKSKKWYQTLRYPISAMGKTVFLSVSQKQRRSCEK